MSDRKLTLLLYVIFTSLYALLAGPRLLRPSTDTHFVYLADSWLHKRLDLGHAPPHSNDWAEVETLTLKDGSQLLGQQVRGSAERFKLLSGKQQAVPADQIVGREKKYYVSFPPGPALLMLPLVKVLGHRTPDVLFTVLLAGAIPALLLLVLRRLPRLISSSPEQPEDPSRQRELVLTVLLGLGSVLFFSSVQGQVWYTAHIVSLVLLELYLLCILPLRHPGTAGLLLGLIFLTRPQMAAFGLLFVLELLRKHSPEGDYPIWPLSRLKALRLSALLPTLMRFALPCALLVAAGLAHNLLRFHKLLEFGHSYLTTMQADNIQRFGLFNYQYLQRNLAAALTLLPKLLPAPPYIQVSYHGLALWFTTPALLYLLWPEPAPEAAPEAAQKRKQLRLALWTVVAPIALASLMYQNDGYIQFGFRFSLDYMVALVMLLWLGSPAAILTRRFVVLVLWGVGVNLLGAISFGRMWQFYWNGFFPVP
jgi:hypothetical protein